MRRVAQAAAGVLLFLTPVWAILAVGRPLLVLLALAVLGVLFMALDAVEDPHPAPTGLDRLDGRR